MEPESYIFLSLAKMAAIRQMTLSKAFTLIEHMDLVKPCKQSMIFTQVVFYIVNIHLENGFALYNQVISITMIIIFPDSFFLVYSTKNINECLFTPIYGWYHDASNSEQI